MPTFRKLSAEEVAARWSRRPGFVDLSPYVEFLREPSPGEGGELTLQSEGSRQTIKRRLTNSAIQLQKTIRYLRTGDGVLRCEVREPST
jgi:hypothetical protein